MKSSWHAEADRLRAEGRTIREIARALGMGRGTIGEYFKPSLCACGARRNHNSSQCWACLTGDTEWAKSRKLELIAGMYNDGWLLREIAAVFGRTAPSPMREAQHISAQVHEARQRGLLNGYRVPANDGRLKATA